jgi:hypothetical protein
MSEPVIALQSLGKRFGDTIAVAGLSLEIEAGENIWISWGQWRWENNYDQDVMWIN